MNTIVRARVKPECVEDLKAGARKMFAALQQAQPKGVRYTSSVLPDGVTFLVQVELEDGVENPLPRVAEFREFQENVTRWIAEPPVPEQLTVIGSYRSF
jgi:hypothetical protein